MEATLKTSSPSPVEDRRRRRHTHAFMSGIFYVEGEPKKSPWLPLDDVGGISSASGTAAAVDDDDEYPIGGFSPLHLNRGRLGGGSTFGIAASKQRRRLSQYFRPHSDALLSSVSSQEPGV